MGAAAAKGSNEGTMGSSSKANKKTIYPSIILRNLDCWGSTLPNGWNASSPTSALLARLVQLSKRAKVQPPVPPMDINVDALLETMSPERLEWLESNRRPALELQSTIAAAEIELDERWRVLLSGERVVSRLKDRFLPVIASMREYVSIPGAEARHSETKAWAALRSNVHSLEPPASMVEPWALDKLAMFAAVRKHDPELFSKKKELWSMSRRELKSPMFAAPSPMPAARKPKAVLAVKSVNTLRPPRPGLSPSQQFRKANLPPSKPLFTDFAPAVHQAFPEIEATRRLLCRLDKCVKSIVEEHAVKSEVERRELHILQHAVNKASMTLGRLQGRVSTLDSLHLFVEGVGKLFRTMEERRVDREWYSEMRWDREESSVCEMHVVLVLLLERRTRRTSTGGQEDGSREARGQVTDLPC